MSTVNIFKKYRYSKKITKQKRKDVCSTYFCRVKVGENNSLLHSFLKSTEIAGWKEKQKFDLESLNNYRNCFFWFS